MREYSERQNELMKYRRERKLKKAKTFFAVTLCVLVSSGIIGTLFFAPFFNIIEIYAVGNERLPENYIIARSGARVGDNIFRNGTDRIVSNVSEIPYVREVNARRVFPNRLRISVYESEPKANVAIGEMFAVIDEFGNVLEDSADSHNVPTIRGLNVDRHIPGEKLSARNSVNLEIGLALLNYIIVNEMFESSVSIDVTNLAQITMNFENRVNVIIGEANNLEYKIIFMRHIMPRYISPHEHGILDMSLEQPRFTRTN